MLHVKESAVKYVVQKSSGPRNLESTVLYVMYESKVFGKTLLTNHKTNREPAWDLEEQELNAHKAFPKAQPSLLCCLTCISVFLLNWYGVLGWTVTSKNSWPGNTPSNLAGRLETMVAWLRQSQQRWNLSEILWLNGGDSSLGYQLQSFDGVLLTPAPPIKNLGVFWDTSLSTELRDWCFPTTPLGHWAPSFRTLS